MHSLTKGQDWASTYWTPVETDDCFTVCAEHFDDRTLLEVFRWMPSSLVGDDDGEDELEARSWGALARKASIRFAKENPF